MMVVVWWGGVVCIRWDSNNQRAFTSICYYSQNDDFRRSCGLPFPRDFYPYGGLVDYACIWLEISVYLGILSMTLLIA